MLITEKKLSGAQRRKMKKEKLDKVKNKLDELSVREVEEIEELNTGSSLNVDENNNSMKITKNSNLSRFVKCDLKI